MRTLIGIPHKGFIEGGVVEALWALRGENVHLAEQGGYDVAISRNLLAKRAIAGGYDRLLYVDADVIVPPDALELLSEGYADITTGLYPKRSNPSCACVCPESPNTPLPYARVDGLPERVEVTCCGFGCCLVDVSAFHRMPYPWFQFCEYPSGDVTSEDYFFCAEANRLGMLIEADTRVRCGHILKEARR